jgi:energy-converting hydrogenase Eha subunit C
VSRDRRRLASTLYRRLRGRLDPRIKDTVTRRMTQRVALAVLGNKLAAYGPIHEGAILLATQAEALPVETLHRIFEEICGVLLIGYVVPIEQVRQDIREATDHYIGMCICRQAERVHDLHRPDSDEVYLLGTAAARRPWMDRLIDVFEDLRGQDTVTSSPLLDILQRQSTLRRVGDPDYGPGPFWEASWPYQEILLDHPRYVGQWRETMRANRRTWRVHPRLLEAWAELAWFTRGAVFTSMAIVDERYTICTCPGPENDGGCLLFNWTYHSNNPHVLAPHAASQRTDTAGEPLPCARFEERQARPCFGCGCDHSDPGAELPDGLPDPRPDYEE